MAEHADGSIIVDTEIDAQGFKAGSSELQRAIKSLNTKMERSEEHTSELQSR